MNDLRFALRQLAKRPGFTAVAVLTLGLGIGATTAVFSVVDRVLLRPLPYPDSERLVALGQLDRSYEGLGPQLSYGDFTDLRRLPVFEDAAAILVNSVTLSRGGDATRVSGRMVSPSLFGLLGAGPAIGRLFGSDDEREGQGQVALLSYGLWQSRFGGDSGVVGRTIVINEQPYPVVGVLPDGFDLPVPVAGADVWLPLEATAQSVANRSFYGFYVVARLTPTATIDQARANVAALGAELETRYPETNVGRSFGLELLRDRVVGDTRPALFALAGAVLFVLLITCVNVVSLLLSRYAARRRELAVRSALGASRQRVVASIMLEIALLALMGGAVGVIVAVWAVDLMAVLGADRIPRFTRIGVDTGLLGTTLLVSLLAAGVAGCVPLLSAWRDGDMRSTLARAGAGAAGRGGRRGRSLLVSAEVALAFVLLTGAGLMLATVTGALRSHPGFGLDGALTARVAIPFSRYPDRAAGFAFYDQLRDELASIPGASAVGITGSLPLSGDRSGAWLTREDRPTPVGETPPETGYSIVMPGYFAVLGVPVVAGREFAAGDLTRPTHVTVINESAARRFFPGEDPVGKRIELGPPSGDWHEIVGVVGDFRQLGLTAPVEPTAYDLYGNHWNLGMGVVVRTSVEPVTVVAAVRERLRQIDPSVPLYDVAPLRDRAARTVADRGFVLALLGGFAATALILAVIGVYGVVAEAVVQRHREFGVRSALGATPGGIMRLVVSGGASIAGAGVAVGAGAALLLTRFLAGQLHQVEPTDGRVFLAVAAILLTVATLASAIPARRAARVDPMEALRHE